MRTTIESDFDNKVKAATRAFVIDSYNIFSKPLLKKGEDIYVNSLPADVWEMEDHIVNNFKHTRTSSELNLTCHENDYLTWKRQNDSRSYMFDDVKNLNFNYNYGNMKRNQYAKKNLFMWADFCGIPNEEKWDMLFHEKNLSVSNSVIFMTFACRWRRAERIPDAIYFDAKENQELDNHRLSLENYAAKSIEGYFDATAFHYHDWQPICNIKYIAEKVDGRGATPMCLIGFSNSQDLLRHHSEPFDHRINWPQNENTLHAEIKACRTARKQLN